MVIRLLISICLFHVFYCAKGQDIDKATRNAFDSLHLADIRKGFDGLSIRLSEQNSYGRMNSLTEILYSGGNWSVLKHQWGYKITEKKRRLLFIRWKNVRCTPTFISKIAQSERKIVEVVDDLMDMGIQSINGETILGLTTTSTEDVVKYTLEYAEPGCYHSASFTNPELMDKNLVEIKTILRLIVLFESEFDVIDY